MSSRQWLEEQARKARDESSNLISGDELMRRMAAAKAAERAESQRAAEHAEKMSELRKISRLLEEGKS